MHEVLVNRLGGLSLPRKSVVRLTDRPDMTLDVYRGRKTTIQQQHPFQQYLSHIRTINVYHATFSEYIKLKSFSEFHLLFSINGHFHLNVI